MSDKQPKKNMIRTNLNNYERPNPIALQNQKGKYWTNEPNNAYFYKVEDRYIGSPTNAAIIDQFVGYIMGNGLKSKNGFDVESVFSEEDQLAWITDYKIQGNSTLQTTYTLEKKISKLYYVPVKCIAANVIGKVTDEVTSYWFCDDWRLGSFKPELCPAFGKGDRTKTEVLFTKRPSNTPIYSLPDWQSGIQYAKIEEELSNFLSKHISNSFTVGAAVNIYDGGTLSDDEKIEVIDNVKKELTGTNNAGTVVVNVADNKEQSMDITRFQIDNAYSEFQFLKDQAIDMIMLAHKVNDKGLFSIPTASGFSSVAEQMTQALKTLYRAQINPIRKVLINSLNKVFKEIDHNIELYFEDFEELQIKEATTTQTTLATQRVSFDYDGVLTTVLGKEKLSNEINKGNDVYIISSRSNKVDLITFASRWGIPLTKVFATGSLKGKLDKIKELRIMKHFDNNEDIINSLPINVGVRLSEINLADGLPPYHANCKCELVNGEVVNLDGCDYCQEQIQKYNSK